MRHEEGRRRRVDVMPGHGLRIAVLDTIKEETRAEVERARISDEAAAALTARRLKSCGNAPSILVCGSSASTRGIDIRASGPVDRLARAGYGAFDAWPEFQMDVTLRAATAADAAECGRICHDAFAAIATRHGFAPDFPSVEVAAGLLAALIANRGFFGVVAEHDGRIAGSNFLDERSMIAGVGPITVDPVVQDHQIGRALMNAVLERAAERRVPGVRLLQVAYDNRSMSLYAKLGFDIREPFAAINGDPLDLEIPGYQVRPAAESDLEACDALCRRVHGHDRAGELLDAVAQGTARVVERHGRVTGYTTGVAFVAHSVAETNDDLQALIGAAEEFAGPGFLVPMRNTELLRWCLARALRVVYVMNLMTIGLYQEPHGAFLASTLY